MKHTIYIALGTNLGNRLQNLQTAGAALLPAIQLVAASPVYETPPWGITDQPAFLNQVLHAETDLAPLPLLAYLKGIETQMGREKTVQYGPRLIDLDLLFYDEVVLATPELTLPHPQLAGRAFVLVPLSDLAPELMHPVERKTIHELLAQVHPEGINEWR